MPIRQGARFAALFILLLTGLTGCSLMKQSTEAKVEVEDTQSLVNYLQGQGVGMLDHGPFTSSRLTNPGREFTITSGGEMLVFEYPSGGDALTDVAGLEGTRDFSGPRHIYRKNNLVVFYFGDDPRVERALTRALGSRIA